VAYVVIALIAAIGLVGLVLVGATRLESTSVRIRGTMARVLSIEIHLDRDHAKTTGEASPGASVAKKGRHRQAKRPARRDTAA
jgi:hypothetical protein